MKSLFAAAACLVASVAAVEFTNSAYGITSGQPFTLTWADASGPVTITLKNGPNSALQTVTVIDSNDSGSTFTWTPPSDLASGTYAFQITDSSGVANYSPQFQYSGNPTGTLGLTGQSTMASITGSASTSGSMSATGTMTSAMTTGTTTGTATTASSSASTSGTTSGSSKTTATTTTSASTSSTAASSSSTKAPSNSNDGQRFSSPLAFILVTVAALVYFN